MDTNSPLVPFVILLLWSALVLLILQACGRPGQPDPQHPQVEHLPDPNERDEGHLPNADEWRASGEAAMREWRKH